MPQYRSSTDATDKNGGAEGEGLLHSRQYNQIVCYYTESGFDHWSFSKAED